MFFNAYLIGLRFTWGSTIERTIQFGRSVSRRFQSGGVSPRTVQLEVAILDGKIHFPLMTKGDRFIRCKGKCLEREHRGMFPRGVIFTREEWTIWLQSDTHCQRVKYYSYEGRESNQRLINTKKNKRHIDRGIIPNESSVRAINPKGRYPFPLISKGER